MEACNTR